MITMTQPSLALHSYNVPGYEFKMWQSWKMPKSANGQDVVNWISWAIDHSPELHLNNVIINCHGAPGRLRIGENYRLTTENVGVMAALKAKAAIGTIWLVACEVAAKEGKFFCSQLAMATGCDVIAGDADQRVDFGFYLRFCPANAIDDYEGTAFRFSPAGGYTTYSVE